MSVKITVIIENENIKVLQFLWSKPVTAADLNERETIEEALEESIEKYVANKNYLVYTAYKNPLLRLLSRVVILKDSFDYPEIETK